jgi:hypothetical protein
MMFGGVHVTHPFSFLCCVCFRPVSCVPNVASVSGLFILDYPFGFLQRLFSINHNAISTKITLQHGVKITVQ